MTKVNKIVDERAQLGFGNISAQERAEISTARRVARGKKLDDDQKACLIDIPKSYQGNAIKVYSGHGSPRESVKAKCLNCVGYENVTDQIGQCEITTCGLWHLRPYQTKGNRKKWNN